MTDTNKLRLTRLFLILILFCQCQIAHASNEVNKVAEYIYSLGFSKSIPDFDEKQWAKIRDTYEKFKEHQDLNKQQLQALKKQLVAYLQTPLPNDSALDEKQRAITQLERTMDTDALKFAIEIKSYLSPDQQKAIFLGNPSSYFVGITLSADQRDKMFAYLAEELEARTTLQKQIAQAELDKQILFAAVKVDHQMLFNKQDQINKLQNQLANNTLKFQLKAREILNPYQLNRLYNGHRSDLFQAIGVTPKQDEQIMQLHFQMEDASYIGRKKMTALGISLMDEYCKTNSDEKRLFAIQDELDTASEQSQHEEAKVISAIRKLLTPTQREKLVDLIKLDNTGKLPDLKYPHSCPDRFHRETQKCH